MTKDLTQPCSKCGAVDFYSKGKFFYCRPCHTESQKRYMQNKAQGFVQETLRPPSRSLSFVISESANKKLFCKHGHPLFGENVRLGSQRNGRHVRRRCRTCERNAKRVSYGLAPEPSSVKLTDLLDTD